MSAIDLKKLEERAKAMELLDRLPIWTADQFCFYYQVSKQFLYQRTCLKSPVYPKIPKLPGRGTILVDKNDAKRLMTMYSNGPSSLKIEGKTKKSMRSLTSDSKERIKVSLW